MSILLHLISACLSASVIFHRRDLENRALAAL
jgi:hypothetical protein